MSADYWFTVGNPWPDAFAARVASACWQGGLFILAVWAICRLFPRLPIAVRHGLWWLACLKLPLALLWTASLPLPWLSMPPRAVAPLPRPTAGTPRSFLPGRASKATVRVSTNAPAAASPVVRPDEKPAARSAVSLPAPTPISGSALLPQRPPSRLSLPI
ncbi:MAG TPA: hypothetical protein VFB38_02090 [Chthonomonadaceae bacterium]|nr:hypothetical protein [Chthonomonadaceae bacterium]